jgi:hypothetical protein
VENFTSTGIRSPDPPARSQSLYRLTYPAPKNTYNILNKLYFHYGFCYTVFVFLSLNHTEIILTPFYASYNCVWYSQIIRCSRWTDKISFSGWDRHGDVRTTSGDTHLAGTLLIHEAVKLKMQYNAPYFAMPHHIQYVCLLRMVHGMGWQRDTS